MPEEHAAMASTKPVIPDRRSLLRAVAWTGPVVALAAAAPAYAGSGPGSVGLVVPTYGLGITQSGDSFTATFDATGHPASTPILVSVTVSSQWGGVQRLPPAGWSRSLSGKTVTFSRTPDTSAPGAVFTLTAINANATLTAIVMINGVKVVQAV